MSDKGDIIGFRNIRGRIIPIRRVESSTSDKVKGYGAIAGFAASAYLAGRFAPPGGLAKATPKVKAQPIWKLSKGRVNYKAALTSGKAHLALGAIVGTALPQAMGIKFNDHWDEAASVVMGVGLAFGAKKLAALGKLHRTNAAFKAATKGSKLHGPLYKGDGPVPGVGSTSTKGGWRELLRNLKGKL